MSIPRALTLLALLLTGPALAQDDLSPEQLARIRHAEEATMARVNAAFGNRKSSQMNAEERRKYIRMEQEELTRTFASLKVDPKAYARQLALLPVEQRDEFLLAKRALDTADTAKREEVEILRGGDDSEPTLIEVEPDPLDAEAPPEPGADAELIDE